MWNLISFHEQSTIVDFNWNILSQASFDFLQLSDLQLNEEFEESTPDGRQVIGLDQHYPARALRALGLLLAHSGTGRDFLARNGMSRTKTAVTRKRSDRDGRVQRQNGANGEGYKRPVDKKRGPISKNGFSGRNPEFLARKKMFTFGF